MRVAQGGRKLRTLRVALVIRRKRATIGGVSVKTRKLFNFQDCAIRANHLRLRVYYEQQ